MKKGQAIKFWKALQGSTEVEGVISSYHSKLGWPGRRTLERYVQAHEGFTKGLTTKEVATRTGWSEAYVEKIRSWWEEAYPKKVNQQEGQPPQDWRREEHERQLLAALKDLQDIQTFPAAGHEMETWLARSSEPRWPITKGFLCRDADERLSVRLSLEDRPEWQCLKDHLPNDPMWGRVGKWEHAYAKDMTSRLLLFRKVQNIAELATGMVMVHDLDNKDAGYGFDHYYVFTIYHQVFYQLVSIPLAPKRREEFVVEHGGQVSLGGRLIIRAADAVQADAVIDFLLKAQVDLVSLEEAKMAGETYLEAGRTTDDLKRQLQRIQLAGGLPANTTCDVCPH